MKFFSRSKDGGPESTVWANWLVELKSLFSVVLLKFADGSRDSFHSHAFTSVSWVLRGSLSELHLNNGVAVQHKPSIWPVITKRTTFHRVVSNGTTWVISFRGPWAATWKEFDPKTGNFITLTHGRIEVGP